MALISKYLLFGGLRSIAKKLRRKQPSSSKNRPRSPSSPTSRPRVNNSRSSSSSSDDSSSSYRNDIRRVFAEYDADGDGMISLEDLTRIVTAVGGCLSATDAVAEAAAMMEVADVNRDGYIGFEEFQALMTTTTPPDPSPRPGSAYAATAASSPPDDAQKHGHCTSTCCPEQGSCAWGAGDYDDEDLRQAFAVYDHDGNGVITAQEIHAVLRRVLDTTTTTITLADCRRMVQAIDRDGDGVVGFHDFAAMMMIRLPGRVDHPCA